MHADLNLPNDGMHAREAGFSRLFYDLWKRDRKKEGSLAFCARKSG